jgi:zinc protease
MLDEGTERRTGLEISEELSRLGATLEVSSNLDLSSIQLTALTENLAASLDLYADVILNPAFAADTFERQQKQQLATIAREKSTPMKMALRVFPELLYGKGHAYGIPFTGSGVEVSVAGLTPQDLRQFHQTWFKPNHATLVVVGDTSLAELTPLLEAVFQEWSPGEVPDKQLAAVEHQEASAVYLIDRPGSLQSTIFAGHVAPPKANPREVAIEAMNEVLGGSFSARLNMNLREDKHWSYGARSFLMDARGQRPFVAYASVQTDKTSDAMAEIRRELESIRGDRPPSPEELAKVIDLQTLTLPGRWETGEAVAQSIAELVRFGFADDYWNGYPGRVRSLQLSDVAAAVDVLEPDRLIWVVVGDRSEIEPGIRALGLGVVRVLDPDGRVPGGSNAESAAAASAASH